MSVNQWKLLAYIKDQLSKPGTDKSATIVVFYREWASILKKMPSLSSVIQATNFHAGNDSKNGTTNDHSVVQVSTKPMEPKPPDQKQGSNFLTDSISELPLKINGLKLKFSPKNGALTEEKMKWKTKKNIVSDLSIHARTKHLINSISIASTDTSRLQRLESLIHHFLQYPDGVNTAVKNKAIPKLLALQEENKNEQIDEVLREALTILGYTDPPRKRGIRILSIDGGGIRGLLVMEMLQKLEELTGEKISEMFDYICGVSTGSVIACTVGAAGKSVMEVSALYRDLSTQVFTQNIFFGARSLIWSHGYYDTELWEKLLKEHVGAEKLIKTTRRKGCPKIAAISAISQDDHVIPFIFRNYELPYRIKSQYPGSYNHSLWEAVRASAAAPTYFEEFRLGDFLHQDGGILVNNPTAVAIHEAKQLWPKHPIQCVVSFGTGRTDLSFPNEQKEKESSQKQSSWRNKFYNIVVSATDTEAVHTILNDLLPPSVYFRFNPYVTELLSMDEHNPEKLVAMQKDALMYIRKNEDKFQEAANALMRNKSVYQKAAEWASRKATMYTSKS